MKNGKANKNKTNGNSANRQSRGRNPGGGSSIRGAQVVRYTPDVFGFPTRLVVKLRYMAYEGLYLSSVSGSIAKQVFSANSIFDPDRTSAGHQPLYYDVYNQIYDNYSVISSKIKTRFANTTAASSFNIGVVLDDDATTSTNINTLAEESKSKPSFLPPLASSMSVVEITNDFDCIRDLSIDPYASETYKTLVTADPANESLFTLYASDSGSGTSNCLIQAEIEYVVLFSELSTPVTS
jgi:hypothetical protein